jgi:hypothetical protein
MPPEEFAPDLPRGGGHMQQAIPGLLPVMARLWCNHNISAADAMSVTLTNAEKQARYRERHLGVDGEKVRVGFNLNAGTRAKIIRLARHAWLYNNLSRRGTDRARRTAGDGKAASRTLKACYNAE